MKKIASILLVAFVASTFFALPIFAEETSQSTGRTPKTLSAETVACMQTAIETRDTAIAGAVDTFAASVKTALTTRKDALKAAWALSTAKEMKSAIKTAWAGYKKSSMEARKALKAARKSAWNAFKTARTSCKAPSSIDSSSESMDSQL